MSGIFLGAGGTVMDRVELVPALMDLTFSLGTQTAFEQQGSVPVVLNLGCFLKSSGRFEKY